MDINKMNQVISWISVFALSWLLVFGIVSSDKTTWSFFIFFFLVSIFSGLSIAIKERERINTIKKSIEKFVGEK